MNPLEIYNGSNGEATVAFYKFLGSKGPMGQIAVALFRAQKCSDRAKKYRRRDWTQDAYQRKTWSIGELVKALEKHQHVMEYGWKKDPNVVFGGPDNPTTSWVFYLDTPEGQVSFHCKERGNGKDYLGEWDGKRGQSINRVIRFCQWVIDFQ